MIYDLKDFCFTYSTYMQLVFHFVYNNLGFLFLFYLTKILYFFGFLYC
jgi:hypothetical protein